MHAAVHGTNVQSLQSSHILSQFAKFFQTLEPCSIIFVLSTALEICRTLPLTCISVSFGGIPVFPSSEGLALKSLWSERNTSSWFGCQIHSLLTKKPRTFMTPPQKINFSEYYIQEKFWEVLGELSRLKTKVSKVRQDEFFPLNYIETIFLGFFR